MKKSSEPQGARRGEGKKSGHKTTIPWEEAIDIAGSEERLTRGVKVNTWKSWRNPAHGVPAHVALRLLMENIRHQKEANLLADDPQLLETIARVRLYWGTRRWEKLGIALTLVGEPQRATDNRAMNNSPGAPSHPVL